MCAATSSTIAALDMPLIQSARPPEPRGQPDLEWLVHQAASVPRLLVCQLFMPMPTLSSLCLGLFMTLRVRRCIVGPVSEFRNSDSPPLSLSVLLSCSSLLSPLLFPNLSLSFHPFLHAALSLPCCLPSRSLHATAFVPCIRQLAFS